MVAFSAVPQPRVAIVGAPNVGKSTLFNRLVGRRQAIVTDEPGVTRDRNHARVEDAPVPFELIDTGGLTPNTAAPFAREIERQAEVALRDAAVTLFVVDARAGATALDRELAEWLRRRNRPLVLVANKIDGPKQDALVHELHALGLGEPQPVSAEHGLGIEELLERIEPYLRAVSDRDGAGDGAPDRDGPAQAASDDETSGEIRVAIVGRPNVGKSSLLNRLAGEERAVVSDVPGTTRDAIDTLLLARGRRYRLIDTAGIRRRGKVRLVVERFSVDRARKNLERCDVALLVLDATEDLAAQDAHIAGYVVDARKPLVVVVNKWDLPDEREEEARRWEERIRHRLRFAKNVPMIFVSAKTGQRVEKILERVDAQWEAAGRRISTPDLNRWLTGVRGVPGASVASGRGSRLLYATQTGVRPPRFLIFCNDPRKLHFSLRRHLENSLRETFELGAAPIVLEFRSRRAGDPA